ncbi:MAG: ABC transporter permease [Hyphomicrobiales bacterium]|nr:ABC transporter permease [Hyphomicrobiales bacterium]
MSRDWANRIIENRILILIVGIVAGMAIIDREFFSYANIVSILLKISIEGIIVIGMAYLIILREIDLSVGETMGLGSFFAIAVQPFGVLPGILAGVVAGAAAGSLNGALVVKGKLPSIAITLGTMVLINGLIFVLTGSDSIAGSNPAFTTLAQFSPFGIPAPIFLMVLLTIVFNVVLQKTRFGRNVFASGGNEVAARYAGIDVDRIKFLTFVVTGALAGLAGVLLASRFNIASGALGASTPLFVITAVLIGGVSLAGGEGSVLKAFQGLLFVGVVENALITIGVFSSVKLMVIGGLLVLTLVIDSVHTQRKQFE